MEIYLQDILSAGDKTNKKAAFSIKTFPQFSQEFCLSLSPVLIFFILLFIFDMKTLDLNFLLAKKVLKFFFLEFKTLKERRTSI
jgi:hypothetical protein